MRAGRLVADPPPSRHLHYFRFSWRTAHSRAHAARDPDVRSDDRTERGVLGEMVDALAVREVLPGARAGGVIDTARLDRAVAYHPCDVDSRSGQCRRRVNLVEHVLRPRRAQPESELEEAERGLVE